MSTLSAEMAASIAFKAIEREMSQATLLLAPSVPGQRSDILEACTNTAGLGLPEPIDPSQPMSFFAFCRIGTTLYHHSQAGCPAAYTCGSVVTAAYGTNTVALSASFMRPSAYSPVVEISLTAISKEASAGRGTSFALAAAAGRNQSP